MIEVAPSKFFILIEKWNCGDVHLNARSFTENWKDKLVTKPLLEFEKKNISRKVQMQRSLSHTYAIMRIVMRKLK